MPCASEANAALFGSRRRQKSWNASSKTGRVLAALHQRGVQRPIKIVAARGARGLDR
jgi:hypothetical protein